MSTRPKALILFSGGLDSKLVIKLLQEQDLDLELLYFELPFGGGCCNSFSCVFNFSQINAVKLNVMDLTQGDLFLSYLNAVRTPRHGTGSGINPCRDCRIFMFRQARVFAEKIRADFIATGEVLGERPMSQLRNSLFLIEREADLVGKILRPLSAKLLPETEAEKKGLVDRGKLLDIEGRQRRRQMELAEKYQITFPNPGAGAFCVTKRSPKRQKISSSTSSQFSLRIWSC